jgi:hypothetical protein
MQSVDYHKERRLSFCTSCFDCPKLSATKEARRLCSFFGGYVEGVIIMSHFASQSLCRSNKCTLVPKEHHQANLGELCSFPEPVLDVAGSQHVQGMGEQLPTAAQQTTPHKLISRYPTKPLQA